MRFHAVEHCIFGSAVLASLLWLGLIPTEFLRDVAMVLLAWAGFSTLLVASAGAWVAFARSRADARSRLDQQRMTAHRG